eukprot:scaffold16305_cov124-Isochrysis_galbana.AAC.3
MVALALVHESELVVTHQDAGVFNVVKVPVFYVRILDATGQVQPRCHPRAYDGLQRERRRG